MVVAAPSDGSRAGVREWAGLAVLALAAVVIAADMTALHLAVPHLSADLSPSGTQLLWIVDSYSFVIAGLLIAMGAAGDRFGRRRLLLLGGVLFTVGSAIAAFAVTPSMLIAARALLGLAGAMLMPSTLSLVRTMFTNSRQRGVAVAVWSAGFSGGATLGPVIGGALLEYFWWGAVFLAAVPVMLLVVTSGPVLLPEQRDPNPGRFDLTGAGLWLVAMLAVVYGLKKLAAGDPGTAGGGTTVPLLVLGAGVAAGAVFVRRQRRIANPLLDLGLVGRRTFAAPLGAVLAATVGFAGAQFFIGQQLQALEGQSPLQAGLTLLPGAAASTAGTLLSPLLARRIPEAVLIPSAMVLVATGLAVLAGLGPGSGVGVVATAFALMAIGFGPVLALGTNMMTSAAPPNRAGAAAGIVSTNGDLSVSLGIALLGSVGGAVYHRHLADTAPADLSSSVTATDLDTVGATVAAAEALPPEPASGLRDAAGEAFANALQVVGVVGALLVVVAAAAFVLLVRGRSGRRRSTYADPPTRTQHVTAVEKAFQNASAGPSASDTSTPGTSNDSTSTHTKELSCPSS